MSNLYKMYKLDIFLTGAPSLPSAQEQRQQRRQQRDKYTCGGHGPGGDGGLHLRMPHQAGCAYAVRGCAHGCADGPVVFDAYEAQNPEALKRAIEDVGRLEAHPITLTDTAPRRDLSPPLFALALLLTAGLTWAKFLERRAWV